MSTLVTPAEMAVLRLLAQGLAAAEVAKCLGCSKRVVDFHTGNLLTKFKVRNRMRLCLEAWRLGLIPLPEGPQ